MAEGEFGRSQRHSGLAEFLAHVIHGEPDERGGVQAVAVAEGNGAQELGIGAALKEQTIHCKNLGNVSISLSYYFNDFSARILHPSAPVLAGHLDDDQWIGRSSVSVAQQIVARNARFAYWHFAYVYTRRPRHRDAQRGGGGVRDDG